MQQLQFYPKAFAKRPLLPKEEKHKRRKHFFKAAITNFVLLQLLFLGLFCYIFGSLFEENGHVHNMNVLFVDYDGGAVGSSVRDAYGALKADGFPTLIEKPASQFPTIPEIRHSVCKARYWAAILTFEGASDRLHDALGGGSAASSYNRSDAMAFVWNEALYSTVVDSSIENSLQTLSQRARISYLSGNGTGTAQALKANDSAAVSVFADPWELLNIDIQPTVQGSRIIYNTLVVILIMIQEFFYLGTVNGIYAQFKIYATFYPPRIILVRTALSLSYCMIGSLCTAAAIYAFRADWALNGNQFVLMWLALWLFAHVNFLTLDVFTIWLPPTYVPMALIAWMVINVTSILLPFDLMPAFYWWSYLLPTHEVYQVLVDIWSGGCNPQLDYALPILFAMELSSFVLSSIGVYRRAHFAMLAAQSAQDAVQARVDAAVKMELERREAEREKERERAEQAHATEPVEQGPRRSEEDVMSESEREEIEDTVRHVDSRIERQQSKQSHMVSFGPAFGLPFSGGDGDD